MNIGHFLFSISRKLMDLGQKLYELFTMEVDITWATKILSFFNSDISLPDSISFSYILGGISAVALLAIIIYNVFKL